MGSRGMGDKDRLASTARSRMSFRDQCTNVPSRTASGNGHTLTRELAYYDALREGYAP
jgi:hypothetical protein